MKIVAKLIRTSRLDSLINMVKLNWIGVWLDTCPNLAMSDNIQLQMELNDILELLEA